MTKYRDLMDKIQPILKEFRPISDSQMVDFLTKDLWESCVPEKLKQLYQKDVIEDDELKNCLDFHCVKHFSDLLSVVDLNDEFQLYSCKESLDEKRPRKFGTAKKWYEVDRFSSILRDYVKKEDCQLVIDVGAGRGCLSINLAELYDVPVFGIEASNKIFDSALKYKKNMEKESKKSFTKVRYVQETVTESTDYLSLAANHFPELEAYNNLCLIGLHTCGSLLYSMTKSFLMNDGIKTLCVVPCCYHLATSTFDETFNLSRNQRMLAQQLRPSKFQNSYNPSSFSRAVLQVVFKSLGLNDVTIGRNNFESDFPTYAKKALIKAGVPLDQIPSEESLRKTYDTYKQDKFRFTMFQTLRMLLASLLEITILLDVALHLEKSKHCKTVKIVRIFDRSISPRSYCIIAQK